MYLFTFNRFGEDFHVHDNVHVNQSRKGDTITRNKHYTNEKLHEIFNLAVGEMTQFRNKGDIGITFFNEVHTTNGILCTLTSNTIYIITEIEDIKRAQNDIFRRCSSIFLRGYTFYRPKEEDEEINIKVVKKPVVNSSIKIKKKQGKHVFKDIDDEDKEFLKNMKNCKRV